ncbi:hypothetical protein ELY21_08025 [Legionella sp. km535]|uniref:hypothetical protein n=1 Tax=Legionella sp. km535 TaxID=2498107 RepID=UPI000F8CC958|nr:hypothetical protein [Legionella sp. km535]RUR18396.1 hypothetical protein ELY21_08025 [Legionella sp. km535]
MMLSPIRFKNAQSFYDFLNRLHHSDLIKLVTNNGKIICPSVPQLASKFIQANDNNIYFRDDIKSFLEQASADEINNTSVRFFDAQNREISLAQIKSDLTLMNELQWSKEPVLLMQRMNSIFYSSTPMPSLGSRKDVLKAKLMYWNEQFRGTVQAAKSHLEFILDLSSISKSLMTITGDEIITVPAPYQGADLIAPLVKDLLKITAIEEIKLKSKLVTEIQQSTNQQKNSELTSWVNELDVNIANVKAIQHYLIQILTEQREKIQKAKNKFHQLVQHDGNGEAIVKKIADLKEKINEQVQALNRLESNYKTLKPLAVFAAVAGLPILAITGVIIVCGLLLPTMYFGAALAFISFSLITFAFITQTRLATNKITDGLTQLQEGIEATFDNTLDQKRTELKQLKRQVSTLELDVQFVSDFGKAEESLNWSLGNITLQISDIEKDLLEIELVEKLDEAQSKEKSSVKLFTTDAGDVTLFSRSLPLPEREHIHDHQLRRSNSTDGLSM